MIRPTLCENFPGHRKSIYGPDDLITDTHGNPISVLGAMMKANQASRVKTSTPRLCYYSPRIPGNTDSAIRLCDGPPGQRDMAHVVLHYDFGDLIRSMLDSWIIVFTAHADKLYTQISYRSDDILLFRLEPGGSWDSKATAEPRERDQFLKLWMGAGM